LRQHHEWPTRKNICLCLILLNFLLCITKHQAPERERHPETPPKERPREHNQPQKPVPRFKPKIAILSRSNCITTNNPSEPIIHVLRNYSLFREYFAFYSLFYSVPPFRKV
jgi:hypothetical protein